MTRVAAILPCRGRPEQTVRNVRRLLATAGAVDWTLYCVVSNIHDPGLGSALGDTGAAIAWLPQFTYWQALAFVTQRIATDAPLLASLANDLIPVGPWLQRAVEAYDATFRGGDGLLGFNGDGHPAAHSCHFLIGRALLARYGGWPVWYQHNFGDTELCQRAQVDRCYAKALWAILAHDHPYFGGQDDAVYQEGRAASARDEALYHERKARGWPPV